MEKFIKYNMNNINNNVKIKYYLCNHEKENIYKYNYSIKKIKDILNKLPSDYKYTHNIKNNLEYKYNNKILKIINNNKKLYTNNFDDTLKLDDGIIVLLENKLINIENLEGLYDYNDIYNIHTISILINNIIELEIVSKDNINYQINIIIPNQNIYIDKIIDIINNIKSNI
tara:strand:+ start:2087 stop:2599 length:513 start_codon:yes stop_codon:yes gene_type:complete